MSFSEYEAVIGLEVHAELKTATKIFCSCSTSFGASPNTQCCPVCMGLPGVMPTLNRRAVELAVMAGAALHCEIATLCRTDRKQYFYPDLPKAYQISQADKPLCRNGSLTFSTPNGERRVGIIRIHIEEDAGKLIHRDGKTLIDYNRCGVPLIEIVSAPDLRSGAEAAAYLRALRSILATCGISDGKMQEGSLRCDVNISVREKGSQAFGVRTEIKNLNSFTFVEKAIEYETRRHCEMIARGEAVSMETRRYDPTTGKTYPMRQKETSMDYRFLTEPDLPPIVLTEAEIEALRKALPELPAARCARLAASYGLSEKEAAILTSDPALADYFETGAVASRYPKQVANLLLSEVLRMCDSDPFVCPIPSARLAAVVDLFGEGTVNSTTAKKLLVRLFDADFDPREAVEREGLAQLRDPDLLVPVIDEVLSANARAVADYKNGKIAALRALQGQVMSRTSGRADPVLLERLLKERLVRDDV